MIGLAAELHQRHRIAEQFVIQRRVGVALVRVDYILDLPVGNLLVGEHQDIVLQIHAVVVTAVVITGEQAAGNNAYGQQAGKFLYHGPGFL